MARISSILKRFRTAEPARVARVMEHSDSHFNHYTRGWDAATTTRVNAPLWIEADGAHINRLLETQLPELWRRVHAELLNNPMLAGVVESHKTDFVGDFGPILEVQSDNEKYNRALEEIWEETFEVIDREGNFSGAEVIKCWIHQWYSRGDHFFLHSNDPLAATTVQYRISLIDGPRIRTSWDHLGDMNVLAGIKRTPKGKVISYDVAEPLPVRLESFTSQATEGGSTFKFENFTVDEMVHHFRRDEPEQIRGYPWATCMLGISRDLRDFDEKVLDAMKLHASQSVLWHSDNPQLDPWPGETGVQMDMERNSQSTGPPGWKPEIVDPKQPSDQYVDWRNERHREVGRPVNMPLLKIRLGADQHNYSSARFDNAGWGGTLSCQQRGVERSSLNPMLKKVQGEASLVKGRNRRFLLPPKPERVRFTWQWPAQPSIDPEKEAKADKINYEMGFVSMGAINAKHNRTFEDTVRTRKRENQMLGDAGLIVITSASSQQQGSNNNGENANEEATESQTA